MMFHMNHRQPSQQQGGRGGGEVAALSRKVAFYKPSTGSAVSVYKSLRFDFDMNDYGGGGGGENKQYQSATYIESKQKKQQVEEEEHIKLTR